MEGKMNKEKEDTALIAILQKNLKVANEALAKAHKRILELTKDKYSKTNKKGEYSAYRQGVKDADEGTKRANASDWYGPYCFAYEKGFSERIARRNENKRRQYSHTLDNINLKTGRRTK